MGKYIADFYSAQEKLVIELDGCQHYEEKQLEKILSERHILNSRA
ncbi:MAG: DUF559 domain-containing protein [Ruminococcus sp.]|nr:DUF559 domain-containing protein [Candidatus Copronaster equi]